jgi:hypothetical protein
MSRQDGHADLHGVCRRGLSAGLGLARNVLRVSLVMRVSWWALGTILAVGACSSSGAPGPDASGAGGSGSCAAAMPSRQPVCGTAGLTGPQLSFCASDGSCPDGQVCFRLANELAVCDIPQESPSDAVCDPACAAGQTCNAGRPNPIPCIPQSNYCFETSCSSSADCGDGTVCTPPSRLHFGTVGPGRCLSRSCASDQECTSGLNGRCALVEYATFPGAGCNGWYITGASVECVYSGSTTDPGACAGAVECDDGCSHICPTAP